VEVEEAANLPKQPPLERSVSDAGHTRTADDSNVANANTNNSSSKTRSDHPEEHQLLQNGYHHKNTNGGFKGDMQIPNDDSNLHSYNQRNSLPNSNLIHTRETSHLISNDSLTNEKPESIRTTAVIHSLSPEKAFYDTSGSNYHKNSDGDIYQNKCQLLPNVSVNLNDYPLQCSASQENLDNIKPPNNHHLRRKSDSNIDNKRLTANASRPSSTGGCSSASSICNLVQQVLSREGLNELASDSNFVSDTTNMMAEALDVTVGDLENAAQGLQQNNNLALPSNRGDEVSYTNEHVEEEASIDERERLISEEQEPRAVPTHFVNSSNSEPAGIIMGNDGYSRTKRS